MNHRPKKAGTEDIAHNLAYEAMTKAFTSTVDEHDGLEQPANIENLAINITAGVKNGVQAYFTALNDYEREHGTPQQKLIVEINDYISEHCEVVAVADGKIWNRDAVKNYWGTVSIELLPHLSNKGFTISHRQAINIVALLVHSARALHKDGFQRVMRLNS